MLSTLKTDWLKLKRREITADEFRSMSDRMDEFFDHMDNGTSALNENLQKIILEQGFQDLTGQVLKRVISLVTEVEENLVSLVRIAGQVESVVGIEPEKIDNERKSKQPDIAGEGPQIKAFYTR